jgi:hypothetical protein
VLCQLSYSHHASDTRSVAPGVVRTNNSPTTAHGVQRVPRRAGDPGQSSAAMPLAVSTSGPGSGTKMVRR